MAMKNPYQTYQTNKVETSSPAELTLMLYNGCLKFISQAQHAIENNEIEEKNTHLQKAQNIIRELMVTLKGDTELGKNMLALYDFILNRLTEANLENNLTKLSEAEDLVKQFRDTWKEALQIDRKKRHGNGGEA
ncbi:flagellar export chaperone FliS [Halalkalibacterium halodurans]|jgi:flagellar protein FliS|uniref:Flagellar secretion chaperone FliS n=1 Tax=Halalkalibacterium halodurans TaxID=86665 RepID=A0A0M0KGM4_ALKHA|nr:flagellar export chaperone FliS [Halalkalibacterium halodurans]MED3645772.1 flagellar export chaperone FliS [Halalkalibacterium halodurans]MED4161970.1 flagellar export chaperone FliS [Halalkalibacterium halodurans]TES54700.1 flagellar export chaperone FliS [Halalkalibacterium halodurans]TPE66913.1 flagellar export chaperone FliS [Halalkalibacterium halodurans]